MKDNLRRSIEVEGLGHGQLPIPAASRIGPFVATGGIRGVDVATGEMPADVALQTRLMFENLQRILAASACDPSQVLKMTIWIATPDARQCINEEWCKMFPDPGSRPARHILKGDLPSGMLVQCEALAVVV
jgi:2-iminobutanoate/2-iminopropanoate deaminase